MIMNEDCWTSVFSFCYDVFSLSLVCKTWKHLLTQRRFEQSLKCIKKLSMRLHYFIMDSHPLLHEGYIDKYDVRRHRRHQNLIV